LFFLLLFSSFIHLIFFAAAFTFIHVLDYCAQWNGALSIVESVRKSQYLGYSVGLQKNLSILVTFMTEFYDVHHRMVWTLPFFLFYISTFLLVIFRTEVFHPYFYVQFLDFRNGRDSERYEDSHHFHAQED
jgi:hypothetical protein